ncbi:hypothetical protein TNIN_155421 [Trichonephila inaurata madagascariensis]|uniref:Uncharacterized protein n=1 Tax=Trichonephila inaurata madagascariensis TaxID=2747483 RepID=A0A8X6YZF8_9ARAC|nr:hypothetical protein TNIN_155421 [Trichonephila inaurata madagascariensis]
MSVVRSSHMEIKSAFGDRKEGNIKRRLYGPFFLCSDFQRGGLKNEVCEVDQWNPRYVGEGDRVRKKKYSVYRVMDHTVIDSCKRQGRWESWKRILFIGCQEVYS